MKLNVSTESVELKSLVRVTSPKADVETVDFCFLSVYCINFCISRTEAVILGLCIHRYFCLGHARCNISHMTLNFSTVVVESIFKNIMSYDYLVQSDV